MKCFWIGLVCCLGFAGQAQPVVEPFLPGLFSAFPAVRDLAMSAEGEELFFTVEDYRHTRGILATSRLVDGAWSDPVALPFSGQYRDIEPFLDLRGNRLYFASNRPLPGDTAAGDYNLWYVDRTDAGITWSVPVPLPSPVNSGADEFYPSLDDQGNLYFTAEREGSTGAEDIFTSRREAGGWSNPVPVNGGVNTAGYEFNAFADPAGRFLIFTAYRPRDGRNRSDLYYSLRQEDGTWGESQLLPGLYSDAIDYCPFVDASGEYLYFTSERIALPRNIDNPLNLGEFLRMVGENPNGLGRIYRVPLPEELLR